MKSVVIKYDDTNGLKIVSAKDGSVMFSRTPAQINAFLSTTNAEAQLRAELPALEAQYPGASQLDFHVWSLNPPRIAVIQANNAIPPNWWVEPA
jgi:hypothetical protein